MEGGCDFHQFYSHADARRLCLFAQILVSWQLFPATECFDVCVLLCDSGRLTQAAELPDNGGQSVVHHTLQLAADALRELPSAEVAGINVPLHQRHGEAVTPLQTEKHKDSR